MSHAPDYDQSSGEPPYDSTLDRGAQRDRNPPPKQGNGFAVFSLIFGILSFCGGITALPGIICAVIGMNKAGKSGSGKGMAIAGLVTSIVGIPIGIATAAIMIGLLLPAVQKVREAAARMQSSNNLSLMGKGMHNYDAAKGQLPPQAICDKNGKKLLSWRVEILPYVDQSALYNQFKRDEPWDSPSNKPLIAQMPKMYVKPGGDPTKGETYYKVFAGKNTSFAFTDEMDRNRLPYTNAWSITALTSSPRGTSSLIFVVEGGDPVIWTKPDDFDYEPNQPLPNIKPQYAGGFMVLMGDGRVMSVRKGYRDSAMRASIDPKSSSYESLD